MKLSLLQFAVFLGASSRFALGQIPPECEENEQTAGGTFPPCDICPPGQFSPDTTTLITIQDQTLDCFSWSFAGICGLIPEAGGACAFVDFQTRNCPCAPLSEFTVAPQATPTLAPVATPAPVAITPAPVAITPAPVIPPSQATIPPECQDQEETAGGEFAPCLFCPVGQASFDLTEVSVFGQTLTCQVWSIAGICGLVPEVPGACEAIQAATTPVCSCAPIGPTPSPTAAPVVPPTQAPVVPPTPAPTVAPIVPTTPSPVATPAPAAQTPAPVVNPTLAPFSLPSLLGPISAPIGPPVVVTRNPAAPVSAPFQFPLRDNPLFADITPEPTFAGTTGTPTSSGTTIEPTPTN